MHCVARGLRASDRLRVDKRARLKAAEVSYWLIQAKSPSGIVRFG
jgi:hypothetical protein